MTSQISAADADYQAEQRASERIDRLAEIATEMTRAQAGERALVMDYLVRSTTPRPDARPI